MATIKVNYFSNMLMRSVDFNLILPNDVFPGMISGNTNYNRKMKTLYLLHGFSGNCDDWLYGSFAQQLSIKYNIAIVMPSGENSFYLDGKGSGKKYGEFIGKELIDYTRKTFGLSDKKEDTFIAGLSMGGFGAIRNGLKYNDTFGKVVGLSSALIINEIKNKKEDFRNEVADFDYYTSTFGNLLELEESENNPEYLVKKIINENGEFPAIFMACGTEDFLLERNRQFYRFLLDENVEVMYVETPGEHNWDFWNLHFEESIKWLLDK